MSLTEQLKELDMPKEKLLKIEEALKREYVTRYEYDRLSDNLKAAAAEYEKREAFLQQSAEDRSARQKAHYEKKIKRYLTEKAVAEAGAKNKDIVLSLLELDKVTMEGEKLSGLESQLKELKKKAPFLFENTFLLLTGYRPEASSDILPKVNPEDMTYSQMVAYMEKEIG